MATSDGWRRYLALQAKLHTYPLGNVLLILAQKPDATRVARFHTWLRLRRHVCKGEQGICILAPVTGHKDDAKGGEETDDRGRPVRGFRVVTVFDYSQTDGEPLALRIPLKVISRSGRK